MCAASTETQMRSRTCGSSSVRHCAAASGDRFRVERVEAMSLADALDGRVISSAVLHFARDERHWLAMVDEMWRVLAPGGILFARSGDDCRAAGAPVVRRAIAT